MPVVKHIAYQLIYNLQLGVEHATLSLPKATSALHGTAHLIQRLPSAMTKHDSRPYPFTFIFPARSSINAYSIATSLKARKRPDCPP